MPIAPDLAELLPKHDKDDRPFYYLWTFDPTDSKVYVGHNENRHPADALSYEDLAPHVTHPDRVHGFAYAIKGGWRIVDENDNKIPDPYIERRVLAALNKEHPPAPLPHIRYHGAP